MGGFVRILEIEAGKQECTLDYRKFYIELVFLLFWLKSKINS